MRVIKDAIERKNEIMDAADELFSQKGYDKTTISDIIDKVGVARGTVYYHFKSKEEIMDALIERYNAQMLAKARKIARDKSIPVLERLFQTLMAMHKTDVSGIQEDIHKPQNALMHQKMEQLMMEGIPPILEKIIEDGIRENLFDTPHPYETVELVIAYVITVFDSNFTDALSQQELLTRVKAFIFNMERLFGAKSGSFDPVIRLFDINE